MDALFQLEGCFTDTEQSVYEKQDLTVFTEVVMEHFAFCMGAVTVVMRSGLLKLPYATCRRKMEDHLCNSNPWKGLEELTNFRGQTSPAAHSSAALVKDLNQFFSHLRPHSETTSQRPAFTLPLPQSVLSSKTLTLVQMLSRGELQESSWDLTRC